MRLIVGSSEAGRLTLRVRAGRRVLATLPVRALGAGATAVRLRVPAARIGAKVRRVVVELGVTDAAGNVGRAALTLRLSR